MAAFIRGVDRVVSALSDSIFGLDWSGSEMPTGWVRTDHLVAEPSFLAGCASTIDFFGEFDVYNQSTTPRQADAVALYSDWRVIGQDLWLVSDEHRHEAETIQHQPKESREYSGQAP